MIKKKMRSVKKGKQIFLGYMDWLKWVIVLIHQDTFLIATMTNK